MRLANDRWVVETSGPGFTNLTARAEAWLSAIQAREGLMSIFVPHTSCSLTIQENSDPDVLRDLLDAFEHLAPRSRHYRHSLEGADDMPAHIKSMLTQSSLTIPVFSGRGALGIWQALYLIEHRDRPHRREIVLSYVGT